MLPLLLPLLPLLPPPLLLLLLLLLDSAWLRPNVLGPAPCTSAAFGAPLRSRGTWSARLLPNWVWLRAGPQRA